jgi:hypothetical protein
MTLSKPLSLVLAAVFAAAVLVGGTNRAGAQPAGTAVYEYHPELGGWLDTERGVIWGYSLSQSASWAGGTRSGAERAAAAYPDALFDRSEWLAQEALRLQSLADSYAESDPALSQRYADAAAINEADAAAYVEAATAADQFSNWRLPSLAEFQDAYNKGLFSIGEGGFNMDATPAVGYQENYGRQQWTSEPVKKIKGKLCGAAFDITYGTTSWLQADDGRTNGAILRFMVVRTYVP